MIHNINIWFAGYLICGTPRGLKITGWEPLVKRAKGKERQKLSGLMGEIYTISAIYGISEYVTWERSGEKERQPEWTEKLVQTDDSEWQAVTTTAHSFGDETHQPMGWNSFNRQH